MTRDEMIEALESSRRWNEDDRYGFRAAISDALDRVIAALREQGEGRCECGSLWSEYPRYAVSMGNLSAPRWSCSCPGGIYRPARAKEEKDGPKADQPMAGVVGGEAVGAAPHVSPVAAPDGGVSEEEVARWLRTAYRKRDFARRTLQFAPASQMESLAEIAIGFGEEVKRLGRERLEHLGWVEMQRSRADAAEARLAEVETAHRAWTTLFGTTQLTHAKARLEAAERRADKAEAALAAEREHADRLAEALRRLVVAPDAWSEYDRGNDILAAHDARRKGERDG